LDLLQSLLKAKVVHIIGVLIVVLLIGSWLRFWYGIGDNVGYAPEQPIPYSHKIHAGDNQIPCMYCHANADKSRHATVPSINICMNCHNVVKTDSPHIQKLTEMYKKGEPIEWTKVHDVADFVYFNHKRHVIKGVDCKECHGDIATMERVTQSKSLNMGFCLDCHRKPQVDASGKLKLNELGETQPTAPTNCYTCHQ
jgi:hypothetical protein